MNNRVAGNTSVLNTIDYQGCDSPTLFQHLGGTIGIGFVDIRFNPIDMFTPKTTQTPAMQYRRLEKLANKGVIQSQRVEIYWRSLCCLDSHTGNQHDVEILKELCSILGVEVITEDRTFSPSQDWWEMAYRHYLHRSLEN